MLTRNQRQELHQAIIEYLDSYGFNEASDGVKAAFSGMKVFDIDEIPALERKWTSVLRLNRDLVAANERISTLERELASAAAGGGDSASVALIRRSATGVPYHPARHTLNGHRGAINAVAFHPSWPLAYTCSADGRIMTWDPETGDCQGVLTGHTAGVTCIAPHPAGTVIATGSIDTTVRVWNAGESRCVRTLSGHEHTVSAVAYIATANLLASASRDSTVRLWDWQAGTQRAVLRGHSGWVRSLDVGFIPSDVPATTTGSAAAVPGGTSGPAAAAGEDVVVSVSDDGTAIVWGVAAAKPRVVMRGSASENAVAECVIFVRRGSHAYDVIARGWRTWPVDVAADEADGDVLSTILASDSRAGSEVEHGVMSGALSPVSETAGGAASGGGAVVDGSKDGYVLVGGRDRTIKLYDAGTGELLRKLRGHAEWVRAMALTPDGKRLVSCGDDRTIRAWDLAIGLAPRTIENAHATFVTAIAIARNGAFVISGDQGGEAHIYCTR